ncbi:bifunctional 4-hydroxy-2-oxoglutarate aldolase/2-dehydro-3-deoxy-phosphogluconate aldolase [Roseomonas sp. CCTCC AB2023176]|uniref:bifunctional 4-hydroxy-2-oxoglutarate aldolase/2-dehydro-3-deoxy-phosphogluconate aldolase n=1 Tax=Roseomonas sp. CCTCC AB2023176 TaxID=3342640 RepID=UPI0035DA9B9A
MTHAVEVLGRLRDARVVPVVRLSTAARAATAVSWLRDAGITVFEITMTIPDAPALIRDLASDPALLVGAGTVRDATAARECIASGARFLVAPWVETSIVEPGKEAGIPVMLGALTPTEVQAALSAGAEVVKIFPASSAGGVAHLKALRSVFPEVTFCPTGGIAAREVGDYLAAGAAFVGMGGRLVDESLVAAGNAAAVRAAAHEVLGTRET